MSAHSALPNIDPIKREPMIIEVARKLVEYILSGDLQPGTRIPSERQLAEAFGVGRGTMREALKSLSLIGLIEVRQGDGTYLRRADSSLLPQVIEWGLLLGEKRTMDLVEARQELETSIAGLAANRRSEADCQALLQLLDQMEVATDTVAFVDADVSFHQRLAEAAGNTALRDIHASVQALLRAWISRVLSEPENFRLSYLEHVPIYEAIIAGDPERARIAMRAHMTSAGTRLIDGLSKDQLPPE